MKHFTPPMTIAWLLAVLTLLTHLTSHITVNAQLTLSSGVVNSYQKVSAVSGATITLTGAAAGATHTLVAGDRVLLVQMTGLTSANGGKFEFGTVASATATSVTLTSSTTRAYTPATEKVQLVWVPYNATSITVPAGGITAKKWDGTTGGIVAILTPGTLTLNGAINADGAGFRYADGTNTINGTDIYYGGGGGASVNSGGGGGGGYGSAGTGGGETGNLSGGMGYFYPNAHYSGGGGGGGAGVGGGGSGGAGGPHSGGGGGGAGYAGGGNGGEAAEKGVETTGGLGSIGAIGDTDGKSSSVSWENVYASGGGGGNRYIGGGAGGRSNSITVGGGSGTNGGISNVGGGNGGGTTPAAYNQYQYCDGSFNCPDPRIWMAGGGQNTTQGGGIVLVNAATIVANAKTISANGDAGVTLDLTKLSSGGGGGGGGGLLVINTQSVSAGPLSLCVKGGQGAKGLSGDGGHGGGSGGSGGGGLIWIQDPLGGVGRNNATGTPPAIANMTFCIEGGLQPAPDANPKSSGFTGTGGGGGNGAVLANNPGGLFQSCTKPSAGTDQTLCISNTNTATLTGTNPATGIWTAQVNNPAGSSIGTTTAGIATATYTIAGVYNFIYTSGTCVDTVKVTVTAKPNAGTDKTVCAGKTATLTGTSPTTGTWSAQAGNPAGGSIGTTAAGVATFTATAVGVYYFIYMTGCSDTVKVTVTAKPNAGADQSFCAGNKATLTGTNPTTGTWTVQSGNPTGATLSTTAAGVATATFTAAAVGVYNFIYTSATCTDTLKVTVGDKPNAGTDQTVCAEKTTTLTGTSPITGTWSAQADNPAGGSVGTTAAGVATATFTATAVGVYNFIYTAGVCADTVKVTVTAKPNAGADQGVCSGTKVTLTGTTPTTGTWTVQSGNPTGATLSTTTAGVATVTLTATAVGVYNFIYTAGACKDTIKVTASAKPNAGPDQAPVCVGNAAITATTLAATAISGGAWVQKATNPAGATVTTPSAANSGVTGLTPGVYEFIWSAATCSDTVKITIPSCGIAPCTKPKAAINSKTQTMCEGGTPKAFTATPATVVTYKWYGLLADTTSTLGTAIGSATLATYTPTGTFTVGKKYYAVITTDGACSDTAFASLTVLAKPAAIKLCAGESYVIKTEAGVTAIKWYKDGVLIAGETKDSLTVTAIGSYTFSGIKANSDMCRDTLCCPHVFEACQKAQSVTMYS